MFCKNCGAQIDDNSVFCASCGGKVSEGQPQPKIKIVCGIVLESTARTGDAFKKAVGQQ